MLVAGKARLISVTGLLLVGLVAIVTLSYNPSFTDESSQYLRKWTNLHNEQSWLGQANPVPPQNQPGQQSNEKQETIPFHPSPPKAGDELPATNPNPFAAVDKFTGQETKPEHKAPYGGGGGGGGGDNAPPSTPAAPVGLPTEVHGDSLHPSGVNVASDWHEIRSQSVPQGQYFAVNFYDHSNDRAINPNIIPHPHINDTWIAVAQKFDRDRSYASGWSEELVCNAQFDASGNLSCIIDTRGTLTVAASFSPHCRDRLTTLNFNIGPHDARVLYGPDYPFIVYGSQSHYACFGQWTQDFRLIMDWGVFRGNESNGTDRFQVPTEIQRPPPWGDMEKNFYFFWDFNKTMYVHHDTAPQRVFAKVEADGSVGADLSEHARPSDSFCWNKHTDLNPLPFTDEPKKASIHQASNSLSITMCNRGECTPNASNTYIFSIYQHKIAAGLIMHARYEPFVMMFRREAPFQVHAISEKPLWIRGRKELNEMIYVTSIGWKQAGLRYEGYLDDTVFVNFGIEDSRTASIDVLAADLVGGNLMMCDA
ncbi:hypothetical protein DOTSEDRAFT_71693 [Dothistroma septosporum NZE10]|uniref:Uncharacterized protein n=1 Tax=Dothistroma septosporum (strain NZE10 / CBS 128990) TaxID=675120 RepID=N1PNK6_DOTSN|nr:hypothetical protein DOTSEDRAFT_71693 [Dothistroma septosporum NZE10]